MPFLGKSGTSGISFFNPSQSTGSVGILVGILVCILKVKLLELEMNRVRPLARPRILLRHRPAPRLALPVDASAFQPTGRAFRRPELRRCHRDCCEPIPKFAGCEPHSRQTSGSRRLAHVRARESGELECEIDRLWKPSFD